MAAFGSTTSSQLLLALLLASTTANAFHKTTWMGELVDPEALLQQILLPGSHNAGAYKILVNNPVQHCGKGFDQDSLQSVQLLEQTNRLNLVETQRVSILEQLELGVRFLDLRLGWFRNDIYLHHTLFMNVKLEQVLGDVATFLDQYDSEAVILKLRLQCGTPLEVTLDLLESKLNNTYGGLLTPHVLSSPIQEIEGLAFVILDETHAETAEQVNNTLYQSVQPDEYYRVFPCKEDNQEDAIAASSKSGSCAAWPTYSLNQAESLLEAIDADSSTDGTSQLTDWKPMTNSSSFQILSWIGVIPIGKGCDPPGRLAILSCPKVGIDSYTEIFQELFMEMLDTLVANQMIDAINVIQVDYVDGYPLEAIIQFNQNTMFDNSAVYYLNRTNSTDGLF